MTDSVIKRNVIILGKTGCGKSTLANKILNENRFIVTGKVSSETVAIKSESNIVTIRGTRYEITVTDTVGFFDTNQRENVNNDIMKKIVSELSKVAPYGLNLIIFVYKNGRFTTEERESFNIITKHFKSLIEKASMLVITNCGTKEAARQQVIEDFKTHDFTQPFANMMQKGIYVVDFPDLNNYDDEVARVLEPRIERDQARLHEVIAAADSTYLAEEIKDISFWQKMTSVLCPFVTVTP